MHALSRDEFDPHSHARADDPATSHTAAEMAVQFVGKHCERIFAALLVHGPMTKDEIADVTGLSPVQVDRRLPDLRAKHRAAPNGQVRQSHSGRPERVWEAITSTKPAAGEGGAA